MGLRLLFGASLAALVFAACSSYDGVERAVADAGSDATTSSSGSPSDASERDVSPATDAGPETIALEVSPECAKIAEGVCDFLQRCAPTYVTTLYGGDLVGCLALHARNCSRADVADGAHPYSGFNADLCAAEMKAIACDQDFEAVMASSWCKRKGTREAGAPCMVGEQCASGVCDGAPGSCGKCFVPATVDQACDVAVSYSCADGLRCVNGACKKPVGSGAACPSGSRRECGGLLRCVDGKCGAPLAEGADCAVPVGVSAADGPCDGFALSFCSSSTKKCVAFGVASPGGACSYVQDANVVCRGDEVCVSNDAANGTCKPLVEDGEPCTKDECKAPAVCVDGVCAVRNPNRCP